MKNVGNGVLWHTYVSSDVIQKLIRVPVSFFILLEVNRDKNVVALIFFFASSTQRRFDDVWCSRRESKWKTTPCSRRDGGRRLEFYACEYRIAKSISAHRFGTTSSRSEKICRTTRRIRTGCFYRPSAIRSFRFDVKRFPGYNAGVVANRSSRQT